MTEAGRPSSTQRRLGARAAARFEGSNPSRLVVGWFAGAIALGSVLLWLPVSGDNGIIDAVFTATSAVCVTGLVTVDTATDWSPFGQVVILALIQIGGFGILTIATFAGMVLSGRVGVRARVQARVELGGIELGRVASVLKAVILVALTTETIGAVLLSFRFALLDDVSVGQGVWWGVFHSVSAYNNAGFALLSDSLVRFRADLFVNVVVMGVVVAGAIGVPVALDLRRNRLRTDRWSLHTRVTLVATAALLAGGFIVFLGAEWARADTFGPLPVVEKVQAAAFASVTPRTAGFNTVDYGEMHESTLIFTAALMFIGGASGSTAGGIKVGTVMVIAAAVVAEMRGHADVTMFARRLPERAVRQALSIFAIGIGAVAAGTLALTATIEAGALEVFFETVSALATVGLSTGITPDFPTAGKMVLVVIMFAGRLGPLTLATALAMRSRSPSYRLPEEQPLLG